MKAGWKTVKLGEACKIVNGATPSTSVEANWGGPHCWITPAEMGGLSAPYVSKTRRTLTDAGLADCSASLLPTGSVILSSRAPIGHVIINSVPMATNQGCKSMIPRSDLDAKFLFYFIKANVPLLESLGTGATFKELSGGKLASVEIPLPPLVEQKQIVALLDEAFAGIDEAMAKAEASFNGASDLFKSRLRTTFAEHDRSWEASTIGEHVQFIDYRGKTPVKTSKGIRLITAKNVKMGYLQESPEEFIAADIYESWMTRGIPKKGDILFTTEAPLANVAQLDTDAKVAFAQRIIIMQPNALKIDCAFLKFLLLSHPVQELIRTKATGATVQGIKASLLKTIKISFPKTVTEQRAIVSQLENLNEAAQLLELVYQKKRACFSELKEALLSQAFASELTA